MFEQDFPVNANTELKDYRFVVGPLNWQENGFDAESVILLAASRDGTLNMGEVLVSKGWERFFYRSGNMFGREEVEKLQRALVGSEPLSYTPTPREVELSEFMESYPRAALEKIKDQIRGYPDPGSLKLHPGEKAACFDSSDKVNVRVDIGTRDRLTFVLVGLDVS